MLQGGDIMRAVLAIVAIVIAVAIYYIANRPAEDAPLPATAPEAAAEVETPEPAIGLIDDERIQAAESEADQQARVSFPDGDQGGAEDPEPPARQRAHQAPAPPCRLSH